MNKFKISKWIRSSELKQQRSREEVQDASQHVRHREHRYWSRSR